MPEPEKSEREPPEIVRSDSEKSEDDSEREKVREAVSPAFREVTSDEMAMEGRRVSTVRVTELLASEPSVLKLPELSEKEELATEMTASVVLSVLGVKVAE